MQFLEPSTIYSEVGEWSQVGHDGGISHIYLFTFNSKFQMFEIATENLKVFAMQHSQMSLSL